MAGKAQGNAATAEHTGNVKVTRPQTGAEYLDSLRDDRVVYIASAGVFGYSLDQVGPAAIVPILIEPRWDVDAGIDRIEYREPQIANHEVFVRGLTDANGELGSTGPIYSAPLN